MALILDGWAWKGVVCCKALLLSGVILECGASRITFHLSFIPFFMAN